MSKQHGIRLLVLSAATAAYLPSAPAKADTAGTDQGGLAEIVVTATKRDTDLQKTPLAITAVGGEAVNRQGITNPSDLQGLVPGAIFVGNNTNLTVAVRGIGNNAAAPDVSNDPSVTVFIDQVPQGRSAAGGGLLFDIDHVELLRGPQGTLYGRNNTAGAMNIYTKNPGDQFEASGAVETGSYSLFSSEGMINVPFTDQLSLRASFKSVQRDGYLSDGYDDEDDQAGRVKLLYQPTERFDVMVGADYAHGGGKGPVSSLYPPGDGSGQPWRPFAGQPICPGLYPGAGNCIGTNAGLDDKNFGLTMQAHYHFDWATLTYIGGYRDIKQMDNRYQGTGSTFQNTNLADQYQSHEIRLTSPAASPITWVAGLFAYNERFTDIYYTYPLMDLYNYTYTPREDSKSYAAFSEVTLPITDYFRVTGGLRYTQDDKSGSDLASYFTPVLGPAPTNALPGTIFYNPSLKSHKLNYKVGVEGDISPTALLYANVSTGYKAGGFFNAYSNNTFQPETVTAYQAGAKTRWFNNRLQLNVDAFYYNYRNYQVQTLLAGQFDPPPAAPSLGLATFNSQKATYGGGEAELVYLVTPNDRAEGSVSGLAAKWTDFVYVAPPPFGIDLSGSRPIFAPDATARLGYEHTWNFSRGDKLVAHLQEYYTTAYWTQFQHEAGSLQHAYQKTNLDVTYIALNNRWTLTAYGRNLENRGVMNQFFVAIGDSPASAMVDPPRTWGLRLEANLK